MTTDSASKADKREDRSLTLAPAETSGQRLVYMAFAVAPIALLGLLLPPPRLMRDRLGSSIFDLLHVPAFTILTLLAILLAERYFSKSMRTRVMMTVAVIMAGGCVELIQAFVGRSASIHDLMANAAGAATAFLLRCSLGVDSVSKRLSRVAAVAVFVAASTGPVLSILDVIQQRQNKELLATFASQTELQRWFFHSVEIERVKNPFVSLNEAKHAIRATMLPADYSMLQLQEMNSRWIGYQSLSFDIARPACDASSPLTLRLRIRAWAKPPHTADSYYRTITLVPGDRMSVQIPLSEIGAADGSGTLNLANVRFIEFLAIDLLEPATFELANVRLR